MVGEAALHPFVIFSRRVKLYFFVVYEQLLHYCSCQNAWLAIFITAPAHQHVTKVAITSGTIYLTTPKLRNMEKGLASYHMYQALFLVMG